MVKALAMQMSKFSTIDTFLEWPSAIESTMKVIYKLSEFLAKIDPTLFTYEMAKLFILLLPKIAIGLVKLQRKRRIRSLDALKVS